MDHVGSEKNTKQPQLEGSTKRRCQPDETFGDDEYLGVSKNRGKTSKMDDLGVPLNFGDDE